MEETDMDMITIGKVLWGCFSEHYPQITGAALQVVGGATVLFRLLGSQKVGATPTSGLGVGSLLSFLQKVALNK